MNELLGAVPYIIGGIAAVSVLVIAGAILSRRMNFNYALLTPIALLIYAMLGYFSAGVSNLKVCLIGAMIVGFYDATAGYRFARAFKANTGLEEEDMKKITGSMNLTVTLIFALLFSYIGYSLNSVR